MLLLIYAGPTVIVGFMLVREGAWAAGGGLCIACLVAWFSAIQVAQALVWVRMPNKIKILLAQALILGCVVWGVSFIEYSYVGDDLTVTPLVWIGVGVVIGLWHGFTNQPGPDEVADVNE